MILYLDFKQCLNGSYRQRALCSNMDTIIHNKAVSDSIFLQSLKQSIMVGIMNNKVAIRQLICPRQHWVPDETIVCCLNCNKQFIPIFRWKHHCRFCGKVFCSKCCEQTILAQDIDYHGQKKLRHCEKCHQYIMNKYNPRINPIRNQDSTDHKISCYRPQGEQTEQLGYFVIAKGSLQEEASRRLKVLAKEVCRKYGVDEKVWGDRLAELAWNATTQTTEDSFISSTPFDIQKEVKVVTIISPRDSVSAICFKGLILQRNSPSKHLQSHFKRPKIITVGPAIQAQSLINQQVRDIHFDQIIKNQRSILRDSLQQMNKLKARVIFVGEHICRPAFDFFVEKGVLVLSKMRQQQLAVIERMAQIRKRIQNLVLIQKYRPGELVGQCQRIYFKTVSAGKMLLFIEKEAGVRSVLIGDCSNQINQQLKAAFRELILAAWMADKQIEMISRDLLLKPNIPTAPLISSIDQSPSLQKTRSSFEITYTKIVYKTTKITQLSKSYAEYMSKKGINRLVEVCGVATKQTTSPYQGVKDMNLGTYLLHRLMEAESPCRKCNLPHIERYYMPEGCVSVESQFELTRRKGYIDLTHQELEEQENLIEDIQDPDPSRIYKTIINRFRNSHEKLIFHLCFRCTNCMTVLGTRTIIGNQYLNISLAQFMSEVSQTLKEGPKEDNNSFKELAVSKINDDSWIKGSIHSSKSRQDANIKSSQKGTCCQRTNVVRVIEGPKASMKFTVTPYSQCSILQIKMSPSVASQVDKKDQKMMRDLYAFQLQSKRQFLQQIKALLPRIPFANNSIRGIKSISLAGVPPQTHIFYQHFYKLQQTILHLQMEMAQIQNSLPGYFQTDSHDWTIVMRRFHKIQHVVMIWMQCYNHIESGMKKAKIHSNSPMMSVATTGNTTVDDLSASQIVEFLEPLLEQQSKQSLEPSFIVPKTSKTNSTIANNLTRKETVQNENEAETQLIKLKKTLKKQRFTRLQGTHLYFPIGNTQDPVSILACCLNSQQFSHQLKQNQSDQMSFKVTFVKDLLTEWQVAKQAQKTYHDLTNNNFTRGDSIQYSLSVYFHHQFEQLRQSQGLNFELYLRSLYGCRNWDSSGGKSNSSFSKSHNDLLVVKIINSKEFVQFQKFAPAYLRFMRMKREKGELSCLAKIFGIYQANIRKQIYKFVVMQNAFLGMQSVTKVYDLKGSEVNRLATPADKPNFTGLDTNFIIDKDGQPYFVPSSVYTPLMKALQDDACFLKDQGVIDYSLLVIEGRNNQLRLAIIDFMRPYHLIQKIQTLYKQIKSGKDPTVIPPQHYSQRFVSAMGKYFAPMPK